MRCSFIYAVTASLLIAISLPAQTAKTNIPKEELSAGIPVSITGSQINTDGQFLAVEDSAGQELILVEVFMDNRPVWIKKTSPVTGNNPENTISWDFLPDAGVLLLNLSGIRGQITADSNVEIKIAPVNSKINHFHLNVFEVLSPGNIQSNTAPKLTELSIEIQ